MISTLYSSLPYEFLQEASRESDGTFSSHVAIERLKREMPDVTAVLLDIVFGPKMERLGIEILERIRQHWPSLPVIVFTSVESESNRELVVQCIEAGANEYVEKAPDAAHMADILSVYTDPGLDYALYGNSGKIRHLRAQIARVAFGGSVSVLVVGESGTGKELVARAIHRQGPRRTAPFLAKNCAHCDSQLLDSELFGHEKGAFTGADEQRIGLIQEANGGVLFLDEIADMPAQLQGKLLRVLETRTFRRLGGDTDIESDFQLVCATNREPRRLIEEGRLREDFYYRISTMTLNTPPLRSRPEDIPVYVDLFLKKFRARGGASYPGDRVPEAVLDRLQQYGWPGNVRELKNVVERSIILSRSDIIGVDCLPPEIARTEPDSTGSLGLPSRATPAVEGPLDEDPSTWARARLLAELRLAVEARRRIQKYKGNQWKAEFMRLMYPHCKAANAKGFADLIHRLTSGPWGEPRWSEDAELRTWVQALDDRSVP